jgi:hypothetical protein
MGVGLVYLAVWALAGALGAGIHRFHALFVSRQTRMQALRFTSTRAALAALCLSLSFSSCKKKDSDPSPVNATFDVQVDKTATSRLQDTIRVNVLTDLG